MLYLKDHKVYVKGKLTPVWKIPGLKRRFSGFSSAIRWQNVYRGLSLFNFGTHVPDEAKFYADIGFGFSFNLKGLHFFIGAVFEAQGIKKDD